MEVTDSFADSPQNEHKPYSLHIPASESNTRLNSPLSYSKSHQSGLPPDPEPLTSFRLEEESRESDLPVNPREEEIANTLMEQVMLLSDRNESISAYVKSLQTQVENSLKLAAGDLANRRLAIIAELDAYIEDQNRQLESLATSKQRELSEISQSIESYGERLQEATERLTEFLEGRRTSFQRVVELAEEVVELQGPEVRHTSDWAYIPERPFEYVLRKRKQTSSVKGEQSVAVKSQTSPQQSSKKPHRHRHRSDLAPQYTLPVPPVNDKEAKRKDKVILDLITCYKQLETLYHKVRKGQSVDESEEPRLSEGVGDDRIKCLLQQNRSLEERIA